jgi:hypothetical protein
MMRINKRSLEIGMEVRAGYRNLFVHAVVGGTGGSGQENYILVDRIAAHFYQFDGRLPPVRISLSEARVLCIAARVIDEAKAAPGTTAGGFRLRRCIAEIDELIAKGGAASKFAEWKVGTRNRTLYVSSIDRLSAVVFDWFGNPLTHPMPIQFARQYVRRFGA